MDFFVFVFVFNLINIEQSLNHFWISKRKQTHQKNCFYSNAVIIIRIILFSIPANNPAVPSSLVNVSRLMHFRKADLDINRILLANEILKLCFGGKKRKRSHAEILEPARLQWLLKADLGYKSVRNA